MRQRFAIAACAIGTLALSSAWAANDFPDNTTPSGAHYNNQSSPPACSVDGLIVSCTGTQIAGVGNTNATLVLAASYSATVQCRNHGGQIVEVKTQVTTSSSQNLRPDTRNGTLYVEPISSSSPSEQSFEDAAICPNRRWTKQLLGSVTVTGFIYTITFNGFTQPAISVTG